MPSLLHQHHMPFPTMFFAPLLATQQRSSNPSVFSDSLRCSTFQLAIRGMSRSSPLPPHPESSFLALTPCHHPDMSALRIAPRMHPMIADNMRYDYLELRCGHFNPLRRGRGTSKSGGIVPAADFLATSVACGGRSESLPPQQSGRNTTDITISGGTALPATARGSHSRMVRRYWPAGTNPKDRSGNTPLHRAIFGAWERRAGAVFFAGCRATSARLRPLFTIIETAVKYHGTGERAFLDFETLMVGDPELIYMMYDHDFGRTSERQKEQLQVARVILHSLSSLPLCLGCNRYQ
jgi:hypothetical protein